MKIAKVLSVLFLLNRILPAMVKIMARGTKMTIDTQAAIAWIKWGVPQQSARVESREGLTTDG